MRKQSEAAGRRPARRVYVVTMTEMDSATVLVTSIGEMTADTIGRDHLLGLWVTLDPRTHHGEMLIALSDNSDEVQKAVIRDVFEVESIFADEAVLSFRFVANPDEISTNAPESTPIYAMA